MGAVHVRVGHDHDLVIAQFGDVEVVSISLGKSAAERIDHGFDLRVGKHFVYCGFFHVKDLPPDGKDCLVIPVSGSLCGTACGISLYNEDLALGRIFFLAVGQLTVGIKGIFLFCEKIGLRPLFCLTDLRSLFRTGKNRFQRFKVAVEIEDKLFSQHFAHRLGSVLIVKLCLGLSLKPGRRVLHRHNCSHAVADIRACKVGVLFLQHADLTGIGVHHCRKCGLKAGKVSTSLRIIDVIAEAEDIFTEFIGELEGCLHLDPLRLAFQADGIMKGFRLFIQISDISHNPVRFMVFFCLRNFSPPVLKQDGKFRIQVRGLVKTAFYLCG